MKLDSNTVVDMPCVSATHVLCGIIVHRIIYKTPDRSARFDFSMCRTQTRLTNTFLKRP